VQDFRFDKQYAPVVSFGFLYIYSVMLMQPVDEFSASQRPKGYQFSG